MEGGDAAVEAAPSEKGLFGIPQRGFFNRGSFYSCKASLYQRQAHNQEVEKRDLANHKNFNPLLFKYLLEQCIRLRYIEKTKTNLYSFINNN